MAEFKADSDGKVYGRVMNELVAAGYYNAVTVYTQDEVLRYKYDRRVSNQ